METCLLLTTERPWVQGKGKGVVGVDLVDRSFRASRLTR